MSDIVILGDSPAAVAAAEWIRSQNTSANVTLFCAEGVLPYDRTLLPAFVARDIKESQLFVKAESYFSGLNVRVILNDSLARISTKRKNLTTEAKAHIPYDQLLIADLPSTQAPAIKGHHKDGIFHPFILSSVKSLIKALPFVDSVAVAVSNFTGFNMACALSRLGKEVLIVSALPGVLHSVLDEETAMLLKQIVEAKNIRVATDTVEEILGDTQVKAIRLKSGKVIATDAVVFDDLLPDFKMLADSSGEERLDVGDDFTLSTPGIFACGSVVAGFDLSAAESVEQGRAAAANMLQPGSASYLPPLVLRDFGAKICDGFCGGSLRLQEGGREQMKFDGPINVYKKVFLLDDLLVGAVWFNALQDKDRVRQALQEKKSLAGQTDGFLQ